MELACLDLEGVLIPEIWIAFAEKTGIEELKATTRDIPDYDVLMRQRLAILQQHKLGLPEIQAVVATLSPLPGAPEFVDWLRERFQVVILSVTPESVEAARFLHELSARAVTPSTPHFDPRAQMRSLSICALVAWTVLVHAGRAPDRAPSVHTHPQYTHSTLHTVHLVHQCDAPTRARAHTPTTRRRS